MVKDGIDATSVEGVEPALRHPQPRGRAALAEDRRAGAVVALGRLDAHRVRDRDVHRRARRAAGKDPVAFRRALLASIRATGRARARRREGRLGHAAARARRARARHRRARVVRHVRRPGRRGLGEKNGNKVDRVVCASTAASRSTRTSSRADGGRHRLRPVRRLHRRDHAQGRRGRAVELPRLPGAAHQRDAADRGGRSRRVGTGDPNGGDEREGGGGGDTWGRGRPRQHRPGGAGANRDGAAGERRPRATQNRGDAWKRGSPST